MKHLTFKRVLIAPARFLLGYLIFIGVYSTVKNLTTFHIGQSLLIAIVAITTILEISYFTYYKSIGRTS